MSALPVSSVGPAAPVQPAGLVFISERGRPTKRRKRRLRGGTEWTGRDYDTSERYVTTPAPAERDEQYPVRTLAGLHKQQPAGKGANCPTPGYGRVVCWSRDGRDPGANLREGSRRRRRMCGRAFPALYAQRHGRGCICADCQSEEYHAWTARLADAGLIAGMTSVDIEERERRRDADPDAGETSSRSAEAIWALRAAAERATAEHFYQHAHPDAERQPPTLPAIPQGKTRVKGGEWEALATENEADLRRMIERHNERETRPPTSEIPKSTARTVGGLPARR